MTIAPVMPTYARSPLQFVRGMGSWLVAADGRRYLDFGAGIAVNALGHCAPVLVKALEAQAGKLWHVSNLYQIPEQAELAQRLVDATFADTVFVCNSGAEAMELSIKLVRKYWSSKGQPERHRIVTFEGAFHGRTLGTISAAGSAKLTDGFGPLLPGFDTVPFGDHEALKAAVGPQTAGILIEPVQGEGGVRPVPHQCLRGLRALCDDTGALLMFDEIQCGMGRTGALFAHELAGVTPDVMAVAKGIGGGFPLGACLATESAAVGMVPGTHGSTYGGNPLACAVGNAVMAEIATPAFLAEVRAKAGYLRQRLGELQAAHPGLIEGVRGEGLLLGLKLQAGHTPASLVEAGRSAGVLTVPAGDNVVRILPALNISEADMAEGVRRLDQAARELAA